MQAKLKKCDGLCGLMKPIWKTVKNTSGSGSKQLRYCSSCWFSMEPPKQLKQAVPIKKVADKRSKQLRAYTILKEAYLKAHPICEYPGCSSTQVTLHHMAGRENELLLDDSKFAALCWPHHDKIQQDNELAFSLGLSISKHKKTEQ